MASLSCAHCRPRTWLTLHWINWPQDPKAPVDTVRAWSDSKDGISGETLAKADAFLAEVAKMPLTKADLLHIGHPWGALQGELVKGSVPSSMHFHVGASYDEEVQPWMELLKSGTFSAQTLVQSAPLSYMVSAHWAEVLTKSVAAHGATWLHDLYLGVIAAERLDVPRAMTLFEQSVTKKKTAVGYRNLGALGKNQADPTLRCAAYKQAWELALLDTSAPGLRMQYSLAGEYALFLNTFHLWPELKSLLTSLPQAPGCSDKGEYCDSDMVAFSAVMLLNSTGTATDCLSMRTLLSKWAFTQAPMAGYVFTRKPYVQVNYAKMFESCLVLEHNTTGSLTPAQKIALLAANPPPYWLQGPGWMPPPHVAQAMKTDDEDLEPEVMEVTTAQPSYRMIKIDDAAETKTASGGTVTAATPPPPRPPFVSSEAYPVFWHVVGPNETLFQAGGHDDVTKFGIKDLSMSYCGFGLSGSFPSLPFADNASHAINGGVPQAANLARHLELTKQHIEAIIKDPGFDGLATFDFEAWTPVFDDNVAPATINYHSKRYQDYSVALVKAKNPSWSAAKLRAQAKREFEAAAIELFVSTLTVARGVRPKALWGFYGFPSGFNNAQLKPIWEASSALYPSIYLQSSVNAAHDVAAITTNAVAAAEMAKPPDGYRLPVFPFAWECCKFTVYWLRSIHAALC